MYFLQKVYNKLFSFTKKYKTNYILSEVVSIIQQIVADKEQKLRWIHGTYSGVQGIELESRKKMPVVYRGASLRPVIHIEIEECHGQCKVSMNLSLKSHMKLAVVGASLLMLVIQITMIYDWMRGTIAFDEKMFLPLVMSLCISIFFYIGLKLSSWEIVTMLINALKLQEL